MKEQLNKLIEQIKELQVEEKFMLIAYDGTVYEGDIQQITYALMKYHPLMRERGIPIEKLDR